MLRAVQVRTPKLGPSGIPSLKGAGFHGDPGVLEAVLCQDSANLRALNLALPQRSLGAVTSPP